MENVAYWALGALLVLVLVPLLVYYCVRAATMGYYRGRRQARALYRNERNGYCERVKDDDAT